jgi:AcrR family transcriptional regulator
MSATRPAQVERRERILEAARAAFGEQGYNATTTRGIAGRAKVSEPLLFRYFGSKEALFEQAVLTPFTDFVSRQVADWSRRGPGSLTPLDETTRIYSQLVELFDIERPVIVALLAVYHYDDATPTVTRKLEQVMRELIRMLETRASAEVEIRGNESVDIPTFVRVMVGMAFSVVALPNLFAAGRISRQRLVSEMAQMTIYGTRFRHLYTRSELARGVGLGIDTERLERELVPVTRPRAHAAAPTPRVSDELWERLEPLVTSGHQEPTPGRRRTDDRVVIEGILHVLVGRTAWTSVVPARFGVSGVTCWRRLRDWQRSGVWPGLADELERGGIHFDDRAP